MKDNKQQKYMVVKEMVEVENIIENEIGEQVIDTVLEEQDFVIENNPIKHKKDELIQRLEQAIIDDDAEIARRQSHKAEIEAEIEALTTPSVK